MNVIFKKFSFLDKKRVFVNFFLIFTLFSLQFSYSVSAQNCTVNAGVAQSFCSANNVALTGGAGGLINSGPIWSQIGGPSIIIDDSSSLNTSLIGAVPGNSYVLQLTAVCQDGQTVSDNVTITLLPLTQPNAGQDISQCPGTVTLNANSPASDETGVWTIEGANGAGLIITDPNNPTTTITLPIGSAGTTTLRWRISHNTNSCTAFDEITVTNFGGDPVVTAGPDQLLSNCFTSTQSASLSGSFAGSGLGGQMGTWNFVSGPVYPTISDVNNNASSVDGLIEGVYVFEWTVVGQCVNGTDQVTITVPPATQDVTSASAQGVVHCNPASEALISGTPATFSNEVVQWVQTGGPTATITNPNNPSTSVTGLDGTSTYTFSYSINNSVTGCNTSATATISYENGAPFIDAGVDTIYFCDDSLVQLPYTASGGGWDAYQIISGPFTTSSFQGTGGSPLSLNLNQSGIYTIRFRRGANGIDCNYAFDDVVAIVGFSPSASNAGTNQNFACGVTNGALAASTPTSGSGQWFQVSGPNTANISSPFSPNSNISGLISGSYTFKWLISSTNACPSQEDVVSINVSTPLTVVNAGVDQTVCENSPVTTNADPLNDGETGMWTISPAGPTFSNPSSPITEIYGLTNAGGPYTITWTISNSCSTISDDAIITVSAISGATQANAGVDQCLPNGTLTVSLSGNTPSIGSGAWTFISGPTGSSFSNASDPNTSFSVISDGTYELAWSTNLTGCQTSTDTVLISIGSSNPANAGGDVTVCSNTAFNLNATPASSGIGTWSITNGPTSATINDLNNPNSSVTFVDAGVYTFTWTIDDGACSTGVNSDDVVVTVGIPPSISAAGADQTICGATSVTLNANSPTIGIGTWELVGTATNSPNFSDVNDPSAIMNNLGTGVYTLNWVVSSGNICPDEVDQVQISVSAPADAGPDIDLCFSNEVLLTGTDGVNGTWSQVAGPPATISQNSGYTAIVAVVPGNSYDFQFDAPSIFGCPPTSDIVTVNTSLYGTTPDAGPDQSICTSVTNSVTMAANSISVGTGSWVQISGPNTASITNTSDPLTTINGLIQGLYIFEWTSVNNNCNDYSDVIRINVYDPPTVSDAGVDQNNACASNLQLSANTPTNGIGVWSQISGPNLVTFDFPSQPNTTVSGAIPGTYVFEWTITTGGGVCTPSTDQVTIIIPTGDPTIPDAGLDIAVCDLGNATMSGNTISAGTGLWILNSGPNVPTIVSPNSETTDITGLIDGVYSFTWQATNGGCVLSDSVEIIHSSSVISANAGTDITSCPFENVNLSGNSPSVGVGTWSFVSGPSTPVIVNVNNPSTSVTGMTAGTYVFQWTISSGGACPSSSDQVNVTIQSNCSPVIVNEYETTSEDTPLTHSAATGILANDSDMEGNSLTVITAPVSGPSSGTVVVNSDGSYTYTPNPNFNGQDTIVVQVCDNGTPVLCENDTIFITVTPVNDPPIANQDVVSTFEDQPINGVEVTVNDTDIDGNLDTTSVTIPSGTSSAGGNVSVNPDGTINYTPPINYSGFDTIIYQVCDSVGLCDTSLCIIDVIADADNDGISDIVDIDDDNDGIPDSEEDANLDGDNDPMTNPTDTDGDGIPDHLDLDSDNDGISDLAEAGGSDTDGDGTLDALEDDDFDGIPNSVDVDVTGGSDTNGDGIDDAFQGGPDADNDGIQDANDPDADGNGMDDVTEATPLPNPDTDGDGVNDLLDLDSDNDGITDIIEAGGTDTDGDGHVDYGTPGDPTTMADVDDDGFADIVDTENNTTPVDGDGGTNWPSPDTDGDGILNGLDLDSDNDGIADIIEAGGLDPDGDGQVPVNTDGTLVTDADGDGLTDDAIVDTTGDGNADQGVDTDFGGSSIPYSDSDNDGIEDALDIDSDNDGITDIIEAGGVDTDNDGHVDYPVDGDPTSMADVDGDGFADVVDTDDNTVVGIGDGGTNWPTPDTDGDGLSDFIDIDADNDGIVDNIEGQSTSGYTPPTGTDTDGDGLDDAYDSDNQSVVGTGDGPGTSIIPENTDLDSSPDYLDLDSDNDGEGDLIEGWDMDGDGTPEITPSGNDADGDGLDDAFDTVVLDVTNGPSGMNASNGGTLPTDFPDVDLPGIGDQDWREYDTDGDGINDLVDLDDDNDGIPDYVELCGPGATGFTCITDPALDDDNDGIPNIVDPDYNMLDTDGDGIPDHLDLDADNDGISDIIEAGGVDVNQDGLVDDINPDGTLINDTNNDGVTDINDLPNPPDFDNDGQPDFQDLDSDNDGIADIVEDGGVDANNDGYVDTFDPTTGVISDDTNGDGWTDSVPTFGDEDTDGDGLPDYTDLDSDNDGIADIVEDGGVDANGDGEIDNFTDANGDGWDDNNPSDGLADFDNDGIPNHEDLDADNDGIPDVIEAGGVDVNGDGLIDDINPDGTLVNDSDGDGWDDNNGISDPIDTDGEGNDNYLDLDSDNDGVADIIETGGTDANGDGMMDDLNPNGTLVNDSDGDGWDDNNGVTNPIDTDNDGVDNYLDLDSDNDGISDIIESGADDTNGDGLVDNFTDPDGDGWDTPGGSTNPVDTDGDGIDDMLDLDSDNDGIADVEEGGGTDMDNDGLVDNFTDSDGDGWDDNDGTSSPTDTDNDGQPDYQDLDSDDDGISDIDEGGNGDLDADNDGVIDVVTDNDGNGWDDNGSSSGSVPDTDGDGQPDYQDLDSDNDGIDDFDENDSNNDGIGPDDTDGDGIPDYQDTDSDGDGFTDEQEWDFDGDGFGPDDCDEDGIPNYLDDDRCEIFVPQAITPNGDGYNETLIIPGIENYPGNKIMIFNRWGNLVFEMENYDQSWNGRMNVGIEVSGDLLPTGTYYYIIDFNDSPNTIIDEVDALKDVIRLEPVTGFIYLKR